LSAGRRRWYPARGSALPVLLGVAGSDVVKPFIPIRVVTKVLVGMVDLEPWRPGRRVVVRS
jgi:hypothetical protein